jgi:hypothetical protein
VIPCPSRSGSAEALTSQKNIFIIAIIIIIMQDRAWHVKKSCDVSEAYDGID